MARDEATYKRLTTGGMSHKAALLVTDLFQKVEELTLRVEELETRPNPNQLYK